MFHVNEAGDLPDSLRSITQLLGAKYHIFGSWLQRKGMYALDTCYCLEDKLTSIQKGLKEHRSRLKMGPMARMGHEYIGR
jgi:hypothetical protein